MTVSQLLTEGREKLKKAGIEDHRTDALLFLEEVLKKDRTYILANGEDEANETETEEFRGFINERLKRIPTQYILGKADFMGMQFYVNQDVLIPRFDTEFLVEELMINTDDGAKVLDVCTGSGCILLSLMCYKNDIEGTGSDISEKALAVAEKNRSKLTEEGRLNGKVFFTQSDLFEEIDGLFDIVVSNPPYIKSGEINTLMPEVKDHEPLNALDGGVDGLDFYRRLADEAHKHMTGEGRMFLEIGYDEGDSVRRILEERGYRNVTVKKDYSGNERVVSCLNR